jgi:hypothetical protein
MKGRQVTECRAFRAPMMITRVPGDQVKREEKMGKGDEWDAVSRHLGRREYN